ncbi:MAG: SPOR domain-containing protein, partial [Bacteroidales bacterium]|jgi:cell division protein FtsN|nr:SPOR domain-containing protein [Bacteroidales bacterium]
VSAYAYGKKVTVNEALQLLANMTAEDLAKNSESVHVRHSDDANEINVINDTISDTDVIVQDDKEKTETAENLETEFYVQIGAYHSEVEDMLLQRFENIAQEAGIKIVRYDNGLVIYRLGPLSNYQEALIYQKRAKGNGINDAFIVVLRNGQRIPLNQVL